MRVGVDLRALQRGSSGGLVQLTDDLSRALFRLGSTDSFVVYGTAAGYRLAGPLPKRVKQVTLPDGHDTALLDEGLARAQIDVLFRPFPVDDGLQFSPARQFVLVPDLQHEDHPELFSPPVLARRRRAFTRAIEHGGAVGLLSQHGLQRLQERFPAARARQVLVPPGQPALNQALATPLSEVGRQHLPAGPFFLYPANFWPHKNHQRLIEAFQRFRARQTEDWSLVFTGEVMDGAELLAEYASLPIHHLGYVSQRLLAELYRRCAALVYVSLYEGFGLPLLEAFQLGAPVLCSNTTSLPDVGGAAVLQCDPLDVEAIAAQMARLADSPELRLELQARGRERLQHFTWESSAGTMLDALRALAQAPEGQREVMADPRSADGRTPSQPGHAERPNAGLFGALGRGGDGEPLISVVVPIPDNRGQALPSIRSWACDQTLPRDLYEVIAVTDGADPELDAQVSALLAPHDRLIVEPSDNEIRLWDVGARAARGRWLFFTEAHCLGDPPCLEEMLAYVETTGVVGASARSRGLGDSYMARMETRLFHEVSAIRNTPGHWGKLFIRGSALSRRAYLESGGLREQYRLFAETELGARLHASGQTLGYAAAAVVNHCNTTTVADLRAAVHDYARGECVYRIEHPDGEGDAYFGVPEWWQQRGALDPAIERYLWRSLGKLLSVPGPGQAARRRAWLRLLPAALLGTRTRIWRADWKVWQASLRCWLWQHHDGRLLAAYRQLWERLAVQSAVRTLAASQLPANIPPEASGRVYAVATLPVEWLTGFHDVETIDGTPFRWTAPLACLKLPLQPRDQLLILDTRGLRLGVRFWAFLNGHRLETRDVQDEHGEIQVTVRRKHVRKAPFQYLVLICEPLLPHLAGVPDQRELGLPLVRVTCA